MAAFKQAKSVAYESMVLEGYTVDYCETNQGIQFLKPPLSNALENEKLILSLPLFLTVFNDPIWW